MVSRTIFLLAIALSLALGQAKAQDPPRFAFPAACRLGETCWVVNYLDTDPAPERFADFRCGRRTYDGHDGTDFAVRDAMAMEQGVDVLAAADGTVLRLREGVRDGGSTREEIDRALAENKGCGNGVLIDHGGGWQSISCHMKKGSLVVKPGQKVQRGNVIGQIGQSGAAEFPHLHFGVSHEGKKVDPFSGLESGTPCGAHETAPLWERSIAYSPFALYAVGFAPGAADFEHVQRDAGTPDWMRREDLTALSFWMVYFGATRGDRIRLEVTAPDGRILIQRDLVQEKNRARQFYFVGKKAEPEGFLPGVYTGKAILMRDGADVLKGEIVKTVKLE
jgi:hypothetical protein